VSILTCIYFSTEEANKGDASLSAGVEIICKTCYIKGNATAQFTINGNFNATQAFQNFTSEVKTDTDNIGTTFVNTTEDYAKNVASDFDNFDYPTIPFNLQLNAPDIPECQLRYQFDGLELYMQLDTNLTGGATYKLNLYTSESLVGISISNDLTIGVIFTIDLILSVEAEIDISSGFHIRLEDGAAINIPMFGQNVSSITL
jgi:hypothetical protein